VIRSAIFRRAVIVVAVLLVSGAAAAMKLTSWTPANMCFCPTPDRSESAATAESEVEALGASGGLTLPSSAGTTEHRRAGALAAGPLFARDDDDSPRAKGQKEGRKSWDSWGERGHRRAAAAASSSSSVSSSSSASGPSASLGGLWKMMSLTSRAPEGESKRAARTTQVRAPKSPAAPKPSAGPTASPTPDGSAFREDATPVADLTSNAEASGSNATGTLGSGGTSALAAADASGMASTPEPASFALIATGLAGIAGLVRRRRI
jgi:PEP-CTERM motif